MFYMWLKWHSWIIEIQKKKNNGTLCGLDGDDQLDETEEECSVQIHNFN